MRVTIARKTANARRWFWLPFLALLFGSLPGASQEPSGPAPDWEERFNREHPPVPEELLGRVVEKMKSGYLYRSSRALEAEKAEAALAEWSQQLGVELVAQSMGFLQMTEEGYAYADYVTLDGEPFRLHREEADLPFGGSVRFLSLRKPDERSYRVRPVQVEDLQFRVIERVTLRNPLLKTLDHFSAEDMPLKGVFQKLCGMAGVDYVCSQDAATTRVTIRATGKTIMRCLQLAASAAAYQIEVAVESRTTRRWEACERSLRSSHVQLHDVLSAYYSREYLNEWEGVDPPIRTVLDAMRYLVFRRASLLKAERQVVRILPEIEKGKSRRIE